MERGLGVVLYSLRRQVYTVITVSSEAADRSSGCHSQRSERKTNCTCEVGFQVFLFKGKGPSEGGPQGHGVQGHGDILYFIELCMPAGPCR